MQGFKVFSVTATATGAQTPFPIYAPQNIVSRAAGFMIPSLILSVSGSLTYSIEVTGDDVNAPGYVPANGIWVPFTGMSGLTASTVNSLNAAVCGIRLDVTAYSSGSVTFQFVQMIGKGA